MKERKYFYKIENGACVGWTVGTKTPGDPECTKAGLDAWAAAAAGRSVIELDDPVSRLDAKYIVLENGALRGMSPNEVAAKDQADATAEAAKQDKRDKKAKKVRDGIMAKLTSATWTPLDQDEAKWLVHRLDLDA